LSKRLTRDESGYSLVEVMASIVILAVAIIPMVGMFDTGLEVASQGGNYDRGRAIAVEELEETRALPFSGAPGSVVDIYPPGGGPTSCTSSIGAGFNCQVQTTYVRVGPATDPDPRIVADSSARTMLQVDVTVTWSGGSSSYTTTGLITKETRCANDC
jgi:prepilin-type N-terminal cleavage/methylation domain-containing protein